jgi:hypothetical protein
LAGSKSLEKNLPTDYRRLSQIFPYRKVGFDFNAFVNTTQGIRSGQNTPLNQIPEPEEVRSRLVACTREASMLRALLRLSERLKRERIKQNVSGVAHAG